MLAGLPIIAFAGADYLLAPPSGAIRPAIVRDATIGSRFDEGALTFGSPKLLRAVDERTSSAEMDEPEPVAQRLLQTAANDPQARLVNAIQKELRRVGCYAGDGNGAWTAQTKVAMRAFNESVHVNLAVDRPDYILLTLIQGHSGKACSRPCDGVLNAGQCIDTTIEARRSPPATLATQQAAVAGASSTTRPSSASSSAPVAPTWSTFSRSTPTPERSSASYPRTAAPGEPIQSKETSDPLPGRMAVGAPAEAPTEAVEPAVAVPAVPPGPVRSVASARPAPIARPAVAPASSKSRLSRTFIELSRNSP